MQIDEGGNSQRWDIDRGSGSGQWSVGLTSDGEAQRVPGGTAVIWNAGKLGKSIYAVGPSGQACCFNGGPVLTAPVIPLFTPARVSIGWGGNRNHQFDGNLWGIGIGHGPPSRAVSRRDQRQRTLKSQSVVTFMENSVRSANETVQALSGEGSATRGTQAAKRVRVDKRAEQLRVAADSLDGRRWATVHLSALA